MTPAASPSTGQASGLKVSSQSRPGCRVALEVAIPGGRCQASYDAAVEKLSRSVKLPGFRKGKVPRSVLIQQLGPLRIRATALEDLVDSVWRDALRQENIAPLGRPELREGFDAVLDRFAPGSDLVLTLEMDVEPSPTLRATTGLKAEAVPVAFDPAAVDGILEQSRRQLATLVPVEGRPAAMGDVARVRFSGAYVDNGAPIEGGSSEGMDVDMEEGRMIPGFVEGIVGLEVGASREVACAFPASYPQEEAAAGREASFAITLLDLKTRELPPLDDAFAQQASDKSSLADLKADLEERLKADAERRHRANRHEALLEALVAELEVELPETLVRQEMAQLVEQTARQIAQQGMDVKKVFTDDVVRSLMETSRPEAEKRLRRSLALSALASAEAIEVSESDISARATELRRELGQPSDIDEERLRQVVSDELLQEKLLNWLEENSTITETSADPVAEEPGGTEEADSTDGPAAKPEPTSKAETSKAKGRTTTSGKSADQADD
ncbi:MAG: trigger factor [Cyanobacteria bacterium K_Offshore_surface_m2_239]|nr:trigger factor [Cyanobacteria bacterium K_Offshore_surface_m2_239]